MKNKENSIIEKENKDVKIGKTINEIFESHNTQNEKKGLIDDKDILNRSEELIIYFNNLIKSNMENENIRNEIKNIQKSIISIAYKNNEMKGKIKKMEQDIIKLTGENEMQKEEILKLTRENEKKKKDIQDLEENIEILKDEYQDIKENLGNIQCRTLSKNI